jgi:hypothetical protein
MPPMFRLRLIAIFATAISIYFADIRHAAAAAPRLIAAYGCCHFAAAMPRYAAITPPPLPLPLR